jgi:hypothetical protein
MLDSVGTSTEEIYWLQLHSMRTTGEQVLKHYEAIVALAQRESKGKSSNN